LEPGEPAGYFKNGVVKKAQNRNREAVVMFEKALTLNPDFAPALTEVADIYLRERNLDGALNRVRQQASKRPKNPAYQVLLGKLYMAKNDNANARKNFETALSMDPDNLEAMLGMARLEQSEGSIDKALARYEKLAAQNPNNTGIALLMASLLERKGEPARAKAIYEDVLKKNPNAAAAANNLAFYYAEYEPTADNIAKAEKLIAPLLEKHGNVPHVTDTAAWVYYRKGNYERAKSLILSNYETASRFPAVQYHLGMIYLRLGDNEKARNHLKLALQGKDQFPGRVEAEKELAALAK